MQSLLRFLKDEDGPTAVEYAVMLALIVAVCIVSVQLVGTAASDSFTDTATKINTASGS